MVSFQKSKLAGIGLMVFLSLLTVISACSGDEKPQGRPGTPPPEAFKACEGKKAGDTTPFTGLQGEAMQAICREIDGKLVAVPSGGPGGGPSQQQ